MTFFLVPHFENHRVFKNSLRNQFSPWVISRNRIYFIPPGWKPRHDTETWVQTFVEDAEVSLGLQVDRQTATLPGPRIFPTSAGFQTEPHPPRLRRVGLSTKSPCQSGMSGALKCSPASIKRGSRCWSVSDICKQQAHRKAAELGLLQAEAASSLHVRVLWSFLNCKKWFGFRPGSCYHSRKHYRLEMRC